MLILGALMGVCAHFIQDSLSSGVQGACPRQLPQGLHPLGQSLQSIHSVHC